MKLLSIKSIGKCVIYIQSRLCPQPTQTHSFNPFESGMGMWVVASFDFIVNQSPNPKISVILLSEASHGSTNIIILFSSGTFWEPYDTTFIIEFSHCISNFSTKSQIRSLISVLNYTESIITFSIFQKFDTTRIWYYIIYLRETIL